MDRRTALVTVAAGTVGLGCARRDPAPPERTTAPKLERGLGLGEAKLTSVFRLAPGEPWPTFDPFLFCAHHNDRYPKGNGRFGPGVSLTGRPLGQDFTGKDGFSMYHGVEVPGFPRHPHRGFETVTVVRAGRLDHSDSLGAAARYGDGDVQWLTAGAGLQHAEMFPLLEDDRDNPLDLFQIWLNLPARTKFARPHFSMLWAETIPEKLVHDVEGRPVRLSVRAGHLEGLLAPPPPPDSWAADPANDVAIVTIEMAPHAIWTLPAALEGAERALYCYAGSGVAAAHKRLSFGQGARLDSHLPLTLQNGASPSELLLLQGRPIREPVARRGPFVLNTDTELRAAFADYRATEFGGWPWAESGPVHGQDPRRFARNAEGHEEKPT